VLSAVIGELVLEDSDQPSAVGYGMVQQVSVDVVRRIAEPHRQEISFLLQPRF
jgi:hypothetical protein